MVSIANDGPLARSRASERITQAVDRRLTIAASAQQLAGYRLAKTRVALEGVALRRWRTTLPALTLMKPSFIVALVLSACTAPQPTERYGFVVRLGNDTIGVESVTRRGNNITSDAVDRFPRVRRRHTEIELGPDGAIRRLVMDIVTPSEPESLRTRHVVANVTRDSVIMEKRDAKRLRWGFGTGGTLTMPHVPQMYSLYELYFAAALARGATTRADTTRLRQFYIDREFDRFSLHSGVVRRLPGGKVQVAHDWLAGIGEATLDSNFRLVSYSGANTTYHVDVTRVAEPPDVQTVFNQFAAVEATANGFVQLSVRDTARATIGAATFAVDYGRPLLRGRRLLGNIIPYDRVWRTGANAATHFTTSAPILIAGVRVPAGTYTLWTVPRVKGVDLIVNKQVGQWGTSYDASHDLARAPLTTDSLPTAVEKFTISVAAQNEHKGTLIMEWGSFRWSASIVVLDPPEGRL
jgi:hypothetical protein